MLNPAASPDHCSCACTVDANRYDASTHAPATNDLMDQMKPRTRCDANREPKSTAVTRDLTFSRTLSLTRPLKMSKTISASELAKHNKEGDYWLAIDGDVCELFRYPFLEVSANEFCRQRKHVHRHAPRRRRCLSSTRRERRDRRVLGPVSASPVASACTDQRTRFQASPGRSEEIQQAHHR